jgi:hypothetical protein
MTTWARFACAAAILFLYGCGGSSTACDAGTCGMDSGVDGGTGCPALNGNVVTHTMDISSDETWAGDGTVHKWAFGATIKPGVTLTVAACAVVQITPGTSMTIRGAPGMPAHLVTQGTADQPVLFTSVPGSGPWGNIANYDENGSADLSYTTFENGGSGTYHGTSLDFRGGADPSTTSVPILKVDHVTIQNSVGTGLALEFGAGFTSDSTDLTVTGGGKVVGNPASAIEITMLPLATLPTLHISGNAVDQIVVTSAPGFAGGSHFVSRDLTIKNLGVPYYMYFDRVSVYDPAGSAPTLTIEPGVELRFDDYIMVGTTNISLNIDDPGRLVAVGTASQPIIFTSSKPTPAAGDWPGLWLRNAAGSQLQFASILFAGGPNGVVSANCKPPNSSDDAALMVGEKDATYLPSPSDFASVTITNSAGHAINAMWDTLGFGPDLTPAFNSTMYNGCAQTKNGITNGSCMGMEGCLVL